VFLAVMQEWMEFWASRARQGVLRSSGLLEAFFHAWLHPDRA
jgi:hypothetical protein